MYKKIWYEQENLAKKNIFISIKAFFLIFEAYSIIQIGETICENPVFEKVLANKKLRKNISVADYAQAGSNCKRMSNFWQPTE